MYKILILCSLFCFGAVTSLLSPYHYVCTEGYCIKTEITPDTVSPLSLAECNLQCLSGSVLWPKPTGNINISNLTEVNVASFSYSFPENTSISNLVKKSFKIFLASIKSYASCKTFLTKKSPSASSVSISFQISNQSINYLTFNDTDESYSISSSSNGNLINITIQAATFFGARHALETLSQLFIYDDLRNRNLFPSNITISDSPAYAWRGVTLDTSRNYVKPSVIKRTLKAMAASKMNTFHWHITDSHSFPYVSASHPELSHYGAYSPSKIYDNSTIMHIIEYARIRGIRVVPELDSPAHVAEGWLQKGVITCFNWTPWSTYCAEPPCGQFDPSKEELYDLLEDVYGDMLAQFGTEVFHMGGDEVNMACWNGTTDLTAWMVDIKGWGVTKNDFLKLWGYYQTEAASRLSIKAGKDIPVILWSSDLTKQENVTSVLDPTRYVIQVWDGSGDLSIPPLLSNGYNILLSNYDATYLDCGFAAWVSSGNNWCTPYKGWQELYDNKPEKIAGIYKKQVLGGITALWSEQAGSTSVDNKVWPRAAAYAETLWTEPTGDYSEAEERMLIHRDRLVKLGIDADEIQPEWCRRYQQYCPISGKFNV
ncbi:chitooligosaccharidolytic beta-N-acetylglucosaminidase-like isoform X2 [Anthonomus grandis grandis]|uniref:chitooligosaccharidolytic beta-N-acetylglucosaminidase-like isoform X2 n=1 Tax=Anthonomus grandis grandis TaxID=2921223 RepID=UPI002165C0AF|nr:chitooligosaccharidolytic beta-N-acetylglucosaminidase-like isoform X2 [Anthonomus grandis grandis]